MCLLTSIIIAIGHSKNIRAKQITLATSPNGNITFRIHTTFLQCLFFCSSGIRLNSDLFHSSMANTANTPIAIYPMRLKNTVTIYMVFISFHSIQCLICEKIKKESMLDSIFYSFIIALILTTFFITSKISFVTLITYFPFP